MEKKPANWAGIVLGSIWLLMSIFILVLHLTGNLGTSFPVPRFIGWLYDWIGILGASIVQLILSAGLVFISLPRKLKD